MDKLTEQSKILLLGASSLTLGVVCVFLFYKHGLGLNYPLFIALVVAFGLLLAETFSRRLESEQYAVLVAGIFFSFMVFVRSSELLTFYNILGSVLLLLIAVRLFAGPGLRSFIMIDYVKVLLLPFRFIVPFFEVFPALVSVQKASSDTARRREIVRGIFMAVIALVIFTSLFTSADTRFAQLLSNIFTLKIDQDVLNQVFLGTFVAAFFVGAFGFMFKKLHARETVSKPADTRNLGAIETMILLGSINTLFFVFIIVQASFLFGGTSHLLTQGLTYAQYAREGFFQLVVVAILSFLIIFFFEKQIIQNDGAHLHSFKIASGVLVLQVIAILVSAFTRLSLYENAYGFTDTRLYSHAFMLWLGIALLLLAFHICKNRKQSDFYFYTFWTLVILLFTLNLINPDVFIAKKNLERYHSTGLLDATYLGYLSDDALPYTISLLDDPNENIRKDFAKSLYWKNNPCDTCENTRLPSWQSNRLTHKNAEELLSQRRNILEE